VKSRQELEEAFARGELPEQHGKAPSAWCACVSWRDERAIPKRDCDTCGGRGVVIDR
jgi:hypothetical protein